MVSHAMKPLVTNKLPTTAPLRDPDQGERAPGLPFTQRAALSCSVLKSEGPGIEESQLAFLQTTISLVWFPNQEVGLKRLQPKPEG